MRSSDCIGLLFRAAILMDKQLPLGCYACRGAHPFSGRVSYWWPYLTDARCPSALRARYPTQGRRGLCLLSVNPHSCVLPIAQQSRTNPRQNRYNSERSRQGEGAHTGTHAHTTPPSLPPPLPHTFFHGLHPKSTLESQPPFCVSTDHVTFNLPLRLGSAAATLEGVDGVAGDTPGEPPGGVRRRRRRRKGGGEARAKAGRGAHQGVA